VEEKLHRDPQPGISDQARFWNDWNASHREIVVGPVSKRQAECIVGWLKAGGRADLDLLEVGCGSGWMCEKLLPFGRVTGTDLAAEVIERARARIPSARFLAGDFMHLDVPQGGFDVIVTLEVLSHVADQDSFVKKMAASLKPGGLLMLATQNRFVLERTANVAPRAPGQIRQWVDHAQLRKLLSAHFDVLELSSIYPNSGQTGILRPLNSPKLTALLSLVIPLPKLDRLKERLFLGHTLMALARKKA
jgi:SAM-dependent methyltransferase